MQTLTTTESEAIAYTNGDTVSAALYARIAELEEQLEDAKDDSQTLAKWERNNGPIESYKEFFDDCFARLAGPYPYPSVTSDYDKLVIFAAIERGEGAIE